MKEKIADNLERAAVYKWIREGSGGNGIGYVVLPDEKLSAELTATRIYGNPSLAWVVRIAAGVEDARRVMPVGCRIVVPQAGQLWRRIKKVNDSPALAR